MQFNKHVSSKTITLRLLYTLLLYSSMINFRFLWVYIEQWKTFYTCLKTWGTILCTWLNKLVCLGLPYFENVGQAVKMELMLFFRNTRKSDGEAEWCHCDNSSFILIPVCLLLYFFLCFFPCLFACLFVRFLFLLHFREQLYYGQNIVFHPLFVRICICSFNLHLLYDHFCDSREKF